MQYIPEDGFEGTIKRQGGRSFPRLCSSLLCAYCSIKLPQRAPAKTWLHVSTVDYATTCVGTLTIRLRSVKPSLPFL